MAIVKMRQSNGSERNVMDAEKGELKQKRTWERKIQTIVEEEEGGMGVMEELGLEATLKRSR